MAHHKSTIKRIRQSEGQRTRNRMYKSRLKTAVNRVREAQTKEAASTALVKAYSEIDKLVIKGIISKNKGATKKSRLTRYVNSLS